MNKQVCFWRNKTFYFLFVPYTLYLILYTLYSPNQVVAAAENPQSYKITVSATIGESRLTLFGWTSPQSLVELQGQRVSESVIANDQGYFFFDRILLPRPTLHLRGGGAPPSAGRHLGGELGYPELCLTSTDTQSRISFPTCLPPLPLGPFEISIGPVLLPPTLSLSKGNFLPNEQVIAQGLTIPDSEVNIFLANDISKKSLISQFLNILISPINAYSLPRYQIRSDETGHFEFNLPASKAEWKIFAAATYLGSPSPKSNTLTFRILGWWEWLWGRIKELFIAIIPHSLNILILVELVIIGLALIYWRNLRRYDKNSSLPKSDL